MDSILGCRLLSGNPSNINITLSTTEKDGDDLTHCLQPWDLYQQWQSIDPTGNGQAMYNLVSCTYSDWTELYSPYGVFDDFDSEYNSVAWTIGKTIESNIFTPLVNYSAALTFYQRYGYIETSCSEEDLSSETRPTLALYCIPSGNNLNGGCLLQQDATIGILNYTHASLKIPYVNEDDQIGERWTSKFGNGPLLGHSFLSTITGSCNGEGFLGVPALWRMM